VWTENQGAWSILVPLGEDDPFVELDDSNHGFSGGRTSAVLRGMLMSDTLVGAWGRGGCGALGALAPHVVGGNDENMPDGVAEKLVELYSELPCAQICPRAF
jgi:hypothetical protein